VVGICVSNSAVCGFVSRLIDLISWQAVRSFVWPFYTSIVIILYYWGQEFLQLYSHTPTLFHGFFRCNRCHHDVAKMNENWRYEGVGRRGDTAPLIHNLATRWMRVVSFRPGRFTPGERPSGTHWTGRWLSPEPVWAFCSCQESSHVSSDVQTEA